MRHDDDGRKTGGVPSNRGAQADLSLAETVCAALACTMKEENDGPLLRAELSGTASAVAWLCSADAPLRVVEYKLAVHSAVNLSHPLTFDSATLTNAA